MDYKLIFLESFQTVRESDDDILEPLILPKTVSELDDESQPEDLDSVYANLLEILTDDSSVIIYVSSSTTVSTKKKSKYFTQLN